VSLAFVLDFLVAKEIWQNCSGEQEDCTQNLTAPT